MGVAAKGGRPMREYGDFSKMSGGGPSDHWGSLSPYPVVTTVRRYGG